MTILLCSRIHEVPEDQTFAIGRPGRDALTGCFEKNGLHLTSVRWHRVKLPVRSRTRSCEDDCSPVRRPSRKARYEGRLSELHAVGTVALAAPEGTFRIGGPRHVGLIRRETQPLC